MKLHYTLYAACLLLLSACKKDYLETRSNKALLIPATLSDMRALLDNISVFNLSPGLTGIADGDFYTTDAGWKAWATDAERNSYTWSADIYGSGRAADWQIAYQQVFYANVVLDGLKKISAADDEFKTVKGTALFSRAFANFNLLQEYALPYRAATAPTDPGIALRLVSDVTLPSVRSNMADSYAQVLADLKQARALLPATTISKSRPVAAAALAMLARTCLIMGDHLQAGKYADSCLQLRSALIDYNTLSTTATRPFPRAVPNGNDEVIYYASAISYTFGSSSATLADTTLFRSYASNDLRKSIFFRASGPSGTFKGNYAGIVAVFSGIATDEMYLVRAETNARQGQVAAAMADLNTLLAKRWRTGTFVPLTAASADAAVTLIINERRKELLGRYLRWSDLKRLNGDSRFSLVMTRKVNGQTYSLLPDSKRYAYPIPFEETSLSGLTPNER